MISRRGRGVVIATALFAVSAAVVTRAIQTAAPAPQPRATSGAGGGRGGASPGPLFGPDRCAGCHGTPSSAGRAPKLFDEAWLGRMDDARIAATIKQGVSSTEMPAFGADLSDL